MRRPESRESRYTADGLGRGTSRSPHMGVDVSRCQVAISGTLGYARAFVVCIVLALMALSSALVADAQRTERIWRIGYLGMSPVASSDPVWEAFRAGLGEHGYIEGQNVLVERRTPRDGRTDSRAWRPSSSR
jgi:hypothetical protein